MIESRHSVTARPIVMNDEENLDVFYKYYGNALMV